ncbi:MAG TPA: hypothetical protein DCY79_16910 [Planctomycetaceae bacterium]|nr:hypothetical protein [Planctomycetaceae bacterium]
MRESGVACSKRLQSLGNVASASPEMLHQQMVKITESTDRQDEIPTRFSAGSVAGSAVVNPSII